MGEAGTQIPGALCWARALRAAGTAVSHPSPSPGQGGPSGEEGLGGPQGKLLAAVWDTGAQSLGGEDPLEDSMMTHSSIRAWRSPWTEEPDEPQAVRSQRVGHD